MCFLRLQALSSLFLSLQSDVIRKPQGQVELNSRCQIVRGEGAQTFQVSMLLAASILDERGAWFGYGCDGDKDVAKWACINTWM